MPASSRTPEGRPGRCPVCGAGDRVEPSDPGGDAPCPRCGCPLDLGPDPAVPFAAILARPSALDAILARLEARARDGEAGLVLDFRDLDHLPSAVLDWLLRVGRLRPGWAIRADPDLREVFRIVRLDGVFAIEDRALG